MKYKELYEKSPEAQALLQRVPKKLHNVFLVICLSISIMLFLILNLVNVSEIRETNGYLLVTNKSDGQTVFAFDWTKNHINLNEIVEIDLNYGTDSIVKIDKEKLSFQDNRIMVCNFDSTLKDTTLVFATIRSRSRTIKLYKKIFNKR